MSQRIASEASAGLGFAQRSGMAWLALTAFGASKAAALSHLRSQVAVSRPAPALFFVGPACPLSVKRFGPTPNPSIEGTCNIRLRLLSHAPHVKR